MGHLLCLWHFWRTLQVLAHLNPIRTSWSKDYYDFVCTWHNSGTDDFGNEFMITQLVVGELRWQLRASDCRAQLCIPYASLSPSTDPSPLF